MSRRPPAPADGWGRGLLAALLLLAATFALFAPSIGYDFLNLDDPLYTTDNPAVAGGLSREGVIAAFGPPVGRQWIPVTTLSLMVDASLQGMDPRGFHLTNVLLHSLSAALLLLLLWRMTGSLGMSALAAALWAFHPLRVESVAWVAERKDVLSFLFLLASLGAWLRYVRSGSLRWWMATLIAFGFGLLAKPSLLPFPFLLLALDLWPLRRLRPSGEAGAGGGRVTFLLLEKAPFLLLALLVALVNLATHASHGYPQQAVASRLGHVAAAPFIYLARTFAPSDLALRSIETTWRGAAGYGLLAVAGLAALTALAWALLRRHPHLASGWLWFLFALAPVAGFFPTGGTWIADRYTYLPHAGLAAALVWGVAALLPPGKTPWRTGAVVLAVAAVLASGWATRRQLPFWRDSGTLMERALHFDPTDPVFLNNLGSFLLLKEDLPGAESRFRQALARDPNFADAHLNLAMTLVAAGRLEEAVPEYRESLARGRDPAVSRKAGFELGVILVDLGREEEAVDAYLGVLKAAPRDLRANLNLGELLFRTGRREPARARFQAIAGDHPDSAEGLFSRGRMAEMEGRGEEAERLYRMAREAAPVDPSFPAVLAGMAGAP